MILDEVERPEEGNLGNRSMRKGGSDLNTVKSPYVTGLSRKTDLLLAVWRFWYLLFLGQGVEVMRAELGILRVHLPFGFGLLSFPEYFYLFYQRT